MYQGIAITHPEHGIFVGHALGLAFWSNQETAGQTMVALFENVEQAKDFVLLFKEDTGFAGYGFPEVESEDEFGATVDELIAAGLEEHLGLLKPAGMVM